MHKRNFSCDETTYENLLRRTNRSRYPKDFLASWMRPPASPNGAADYGLDQRKYGTAARLENDAVLAN
jgi:hypothetical protein